MPGHFPATGRRNVGTSYEGVAACSNCSQILPVLSITERILLAMRRKLLTNAGVISVVVVAGVLVGTSLPAWGARRRPVPATKALLEHFAVVDHGHRGYRTAVVASGSGDTDNFITTLTDRPLTKGFGLAPNSAETIMSSGGFPVTVVPGNTGICAVMTEPQADAFPAAVPGPGRMVSVCASLLKATTQGVAASVGELNGKTIFYGLVPNGVATASLSLGNGNTMSIPIVANIYASEITGTVTAITLRNSSGATVTG